MPTLQSTQTKPETWNPHLIIGLISITVIVFVLEVVVPPGIATSIAYTCVILICYLDSGYKNLYFFSTFCIMLVAADFFISHSGENHDNVVFFNRVISITCIALAAIFTKKFKKLTEKHKNSEILMKSILSSAKEAV